MTGTLGIDTSNYKTSAAVYRKDGEWLVNGKLLDVPRGELGLRQNDALFLHTKALPEILKPAMEAPEEFSAVGVSYAPRRSENSYMPCFLAGKSTGKIISDALKIQFFTFSHQEGHLAAAALSAGREDLLSGEFLAWHLSGGTSELLLVRPDKDHVIDALVIGGTNDLAAGQLIDRAGVLLKLRFPAGEALDDLSAGAGAKNYMRVKTNGLFFSLSGAENKINEQAEAGRQPEDISYFAISTVLNAVLDVTLKVKKQYNLPLLCSGGVMANRMIGEELKKTGAIFAGPGLSGDNALGVAYLAALKLEV
ncbi:MAG: DNA-binding protein [Bacillota bacterium]|nr:DNA-binding protein [Bacillota bacterium]